jgi:cytoskeletal protein RodZ
MNSRNLIVAFVTVSIAALIVSCLAVISVARTYTAALASEREAESVSVREQTSEPPKEVTEKTPETEETTREETSTSPESSTVTDTTETESVTESTEKASDFVLSFASDRLVIRDPAGNVIYERLIDRSGLHPKDLEALLIGISFPDNESAMNAVYDLIS